jgi:hypothetical protein
VSRGVGLGGRDRSATPEIERARSAVSKRIKAGPRQLAAEDPALGLHLSATISTGYFCCYRPAAAAPAWDVG